MTITPSDAPVFCTHARPIESCIVHAPGRPVPAMPAKLARCSSCLGYHGKTGRDRCPYSAKEAEAVKASRAKAMKSAETPEVPTGSRKRPVADFVEIQRNSAAELRRTNSHLRKCLETAPAEAGPADDRHQQMGTAAQEVQSDRVR